MHRFSEIEERGTGGTFLGTWTWGRGHCFAVCALSPARVGRWRAKRGLIGGASGGEASGDGISGVGVGGAVGQPVPAVHVPSSSSAPLGSAQSAYGALWRCGSQTPPDHRVGLLSPGAPTEAPTDAAPRNVLHARSRVCEVCALGQGAASVPRHLPGKSPLLQRL